MTLSLFAQGYVWAIGQLLNKTKYQCKIA